MIPSVLRDAYKLAKIVIHDSFCPILKYEFHLRASNLLCSYKQKVCVLQLFMHIREGREIPITIPHERVAAITTITEDSAEPHGGSDVLGQPDLPPSVCCRDEQAPPLGGVDLPAWPQCVGG